MRPQEKADFLETAEECIKDLENKKYSVLIAGKTSNRNWHACRAFSLDLLSFLGKLITDTIFQHHVKKP